MDFKQQGDASKWWNRRLKGGGRTAFALFIAVFALIFGEKTLFADDLEEYDAKSLQAVLNIPIVPLKDEYSTLRVLFHLRKPVRFTAFLMAQEEGFYAAEGLPPIEFVWLDNSSNVNVSPRNDDVQFMTNRLARVYRLACLGNPAVSIDQISTRSALGVLYRKELFPDVTKLEHLQHLKLGTFYRVLEEPLVTCVKAKLPKDIVYFCGDGQILLRTGAIDGLYCSEIDLPKLMEYTKWRDDFGFLPLAGTESDLPGQSMNCRLDFAAKFPDLCEKFARASYRGLQAAMQNPARAREVLKKYYDQLKLVYDEVIITEQLKICVPLTDPKERLEDNGDFSREQFETMKSHLIDAGLISEETAVSYDDFIFPILKPGTKERLQAAWEREKAKIEGKTAETNAPASDANDNANDNANDETNADAAESAP